MIYKCCVFWEGVGPRFLFFIMAFDLNEITGKEKMNETDAWNR